MFSEIWMDLAYSRYASTRRYALATRVSRLGIWVAWQVSRCYMNTLEAIVTRLMQEGWMGR